MLRFRQLQALHAVIDTGTVTSAANLLGVSQPAISNLLAQLEDKTRFRLFVRQKGRLSPTPEAMLLYDEIDTVVRGLNQVSQTVTDLQNQRSGHLQIACLHAMSFGFLPDLISRFIAEQPEIMVSLQTRYSSKIQEWVLANLYELGICELPVELRGLEQRTMSFECMCAVPEDHVLAQHRELKPIDLDGVPFIVMGKEHMTYHRTVQQFSHAGSVLNIRCQAHLFRTALEFVKQGMGVALIDPFTLSYDDGRGYVTIPFKPEVHLDLAIIYGKDRPLSALAENFLALLDEEMREHLANPGKN